VISPLVSLIADQQIQAPQPSQGLHAGTDAKIVTETYGQMHNDLKIVFVTPERISKSKRFMNVLEKCKRLERIVIDEVSRS